MNVLFVADDLYPGFGGQARATEGHIAALIARGHSVKALAGEEPSPSAPPKGVEVVRLPSWRLGSSQTRFAHPLVSVARPLVRWADVVHANTPAALTAVVALLARGMGVPVVMGVHTQLETSSLHAPLVGPAVSALLTVWYRYLFGLADLLVAPTPYAARLVTPFTLREPVAVSNGLDLGLWPDPVPDANLPAGHRLAYVGRLSPEKMPEALLDLMAALPDDYTLSVAGTGPLERELSERIDSLGLQNRVRLLGRVTEEEKRALLTSASAFLMPSPAELQSIASLEAFAAGTPVVAWGHASSAVPSIVEESGAGVVVDPVDTAAQARDLRELLEDRRAHEDSRAAARRYAARHDVARSAERLEELYRGLLGGR